MAFGDRKGELVVVIGCGMNGLERTKLVPNVLWIRDKIWCFLGQD